MHLEENEERGAGETDREKTGSAGFGVCFESPAAHSGIDLVWEVSLARS